MNSRLRGRKGVIVVSVVENVKEWQAGHAG